MDIRVRRAREEDLPVIASLTRHASPSPLGELRDDDSGLALVAVGPDDVPVGLARVLLASAREAWLHPSQVHRPERDDGVGSLLDDEACRWAASRGAVVARRLVEDEDEAGRDRAVGLGYRPVAPWVVATRQLAPLEIDPHTNGGHRVPGEERLVPGTSAETEPAWIAWSSSDLASTGRQLFPSGGHFRRMTTDDVVEAARRRGLWHCPSGWVILDPEEAGDLVVRWVVTNDLDVPRLLHAVLDRAEATGMEVVRLLAPRVGWMEEALQGLGFEQAGVTIYARAL